METDEPQSTNFTRGTDKPANKTLADILRETGVVKEDDIQKIIDNINTEELSAVITATNKSLNNSKNEPDNSRNLSGDSETSKTSEQSAKTGKTVKSDKSHKTTELNRTETNEPETFIDQKIDACDEFGMNYAKLYNFCTKHPQDTLKYELGQVLYPAFVYGYLQLVENNMPDEAELLFSNYSADLHSQYTEAMDALSGVTKPEWVRKNQFANSFRSRVFYVQMNKDAQQELKTFLEHKNNVSDLRCMNDLISFTVRRTERSKIVINFKAPGNVEPPFYEGGSRSMVSTRVSYGTVTLQIANFKGSVAMVL